MKLSNSKMGAQSLPLYSYTVYAFKEIMILRKIEFPCCIRPVTTPAVEYGMSGIPVIEVRVFSRVFRGTLTHWRTASKSTKGNVIIGNVMVAAKMIKIANENEKIGAIDLGRYALL